MSSSNRKRIDCLKRLATRLLWGTALLCTACAGPPGHDRDAGFTPNESYSRSLETDAEKNALSAKMSLPEWQDRPWWEYYEDPELNALVSGALTENPGIGQIRSRLAQAAATADKSFADLLPAADASGARTASNGKPAKHSSFSLNGAASYELDLWGGLRASHQADNLSAQAAAQDLRMAAITLSASIVESWLELLSLKEEEALLQSQIKTNEMILALQQKRYENGAARVLDVLQQTEVLERARAQLPDIRAAQDLALHRIALLAGRDPSRPLPIGRKKLPDTLPIPAAGIPAALLDGRPDIDAAWRRVASADQAAQAAWADRLPGFNIAADYSTASAKFKNLFDLWALDLALRLAAPLFDGGARAAEQARREALADERFQAYRETVLRAAGEVEDALSRNAHQAEKIKAIGKQLDVSRSALEQATISYGNGDTDYISVLNSLTAAQSLEIQLLRARRDLALYRVGLYRALGIRVWNESISEIVEKAHD